MFFFFSSRRRHTRSVSAFLLNRSSDLQQEQESEGILQSPAYHKRKPQRSDEHESGDRKSGSAGMPRPISYAVFCLKKKTSPITHRASMIATCSPRGARTRSEEHKSGLQSR